MEKILLLGYMGSGKTITGKLLSMKSKIKWIDLDKFIEEKENLSIKEIFETKGELYFRKLEHQVLKEIIESDEKLIISLGGGTPCYHNNHEFFLNKNVRSIYLKASIDVLCIRLETEREDRPLIANLSDSEIREFVSKQMIERSLYYEKATTTVSVDNRNLSQIMNEIFDMIQ